jgi:hypothetical protein
MQKMGRLRAERRAAKLVELRQRIRKHPNFLETVVAKYLFDIRASNVGAVVSLDSRWVYET